MKIPVHYYREIKSGTIIVNQGGKTYLVEIW